jgi:flavodoxin
MKSLVVYDSYFGNTEKVAKAVGKLLKAKVVKVDKFKSSDLDGIDILVVGCPTRAFSATPVIKKFIKSLKLDGVKVAAFDTRADLKRVNSKFLEFMVGLLGYAAEPMSKKLIRQGGVSAVEPIGFLVEDTEGPLGEGEIKRAEKWAREIK